jgi:hypothetical protein
MGWYGDVKESRTRTIEACNVDPKGAIPRAFEHPPHKTCAAASTVPAASVSSSMVSGTLGGPQLYVATANRPPLMKSSGAVNARPDSRSFDSVSAVRRICS